MFISPHNHTESPISGSSISTFIDKTLELNRTHFVHTEHGTLHSAFKVYKKAKEKNLKPILGIEIYLEPENEQDKSKYYTTTLHCLNQEAYQALVKLVSSDHFKSIQIRDEICQLWTWKDLELMSNYDITLVLGGIHCTVGKHLLAGNPETGQKVFLKLKEMFKDNFYSSLICEPWTKRYVSIVEIFYTDNTKDSILSTDYVTTDKARKMKATDLIDRPGHSKVEARYSNGLYCKVDKYIKDIKLHKGYIPYGVDVTHKINSFLYALSKRHDVQVLASDYAYYCNKEDKIVQELALEGKTKFYSNLYMKTNEEILDYLTNTMNFKQDETNNIICNNASWAQKFDNFELKYSPRLAECEGTGIKRMMEIIQNNGRMKWDNPEWVARLKEEISVIEQNGIMSMTAYFLPKHDVLAYYKKNNRLTGPGRGSAAGCLIAYLMGITQVDPFRFGLSFSRFYSLDRIKDSKIADIDSDLEDRDLLVGEDKKSGYLYKRWGNKAAQISTNTMLRLKSSIKDVNRYLKGSVEAEIELLSKNLPAPPQGITDNEFIFGFNDQEGDHIDGLIETSQELKKYTLERPEEWRIVQKMLGLVRSVSTHACAFVISDRPISDTVPTREGHITQYTAAEVEAAGLVKYDFLVISQLKDIRICLDYTNKRDESGLPFDHFLHNGQSTFIWDLPEELEVFKSIWKGDTESIFQISTQSMIPYVMDIKPRSIEDLGIVVALVRPGPLDYIDPTTNRSMAQEYVHRRQGGEYKDIAVLNELIPETYSVLIYQEQVTKIAKELAGFDGSAAEKLREAIGKKKLSTLMSIKPKFVNGCIDSNKVTESEAEELWERIVTFGRYAFNKSHAISYAYVTYACMFLKYHHNLEWWTSVLTNATESEITQKFWPHVKHLLAPPDINLSSENMEIDYQNVKIRSKLGVIHGLGEKTILPIVQNRPYKDIQDFVDKEVSGPSLAHKLIHVGILDSLFPPNLSLCEKLLAYQNAIELKKFKDKVKECELKGTKMRSTQPKQAFIPEEYLDLHPFKDAAMKKSVLPSMPIDLYGIAKVHSTAIAPYVTRPMINNHKGYGTLLIDGESLRRLDEIEGDLIKNDIYVATTCYIVDSKEFSYPKKNPTKKALKLILSADNYLSEKVLWPDYNTGELKYPKGTAKGSIVTIFMRKKPGRKDMSIQEIIVEYS